MSAQIDPKRPVDVYIIDCGLQPSVRSDIEARSAANVHCHWLASKRPGELGAPRWGNLSGATFERLIIEEYLPRDLDRVLWLDCDLLILDDLTQLFDQPLHGAVLAAARDPFVARLDSPFGIACWKELGLAGDAPYFNAGVLLIDLNLWRRRQLGGQCLAYLRERGSQVFFSDQEALNAIVGADWVALEDRWNASANRFHSRMQDLQGQPPSIIHFAGRVKPWNVPNLGAKQDLFFESVDRTAWQGQRPATSARNRLLSWYLGSALREWTYWIENLQLRFRHWAGR